jgi:hypothetical protein|tara:strand:+ start:804 stop:1085 length:282 start_codon:yes stop_codon:yes gene_type:complete
MGNVFESIIPPEEYQNQIEKQSFDIMANELIIEQLKMALINIKKDIRSIQFYEPDDYNLDTICENIDQALQGKYPEKFKLPANINNEKINVHT